MTYIRTFWNVVNVKTPPLGIRKRDDTKKPITGLDSDALLYLLGNVFRLAPRLERENQVKEHETIWIEQ